MNSTLKNVLLIVLGCAIGYGICWWMSCRHHDKDDCKGGKMGHHEKCDDKDSIRENHMVWDPNCKPGPDNGIMVDRSAMAIAVNRYKSFLGADSSKPGSVGGRISICTLRNILSSIEDQQQNFQYMNFWLGLEDPNTKIPTVYIIGGTMQSGQEQSKLVVFKSGNMGFCPTQCTLPPGQ